MSSQDRRSPQNILRHKRLLTRAKNNPSLLLQDARYHKEAFLKDFLSTCETKALTEPHRALHYTRATMALAKRLGIRHLLNLSLGTHVHALLAAGEYREAEHVAESYFASARGCCRACLVDWFRRLTDVMLETYSWHKAEGFLALAFRIALEDHQPEPLVLQLHFLRTIVRYGRRDPAGALDDARQVLQKMPFTESDGYFIDTLAFIAKILRASPPAHKGHRELALRMVSDFRQRLQGNKLPHVRARLLWVEGLLHGLQDDHRSTLSRLEAARNIHFRGFPVNYFVALCLDLAQLHSLRGDPSHRRDAHRLLDACLLRDDLHDPRLRLGLERAMDLLQMGTRDQGLDELLWLRDSFTVPVPGLLGLADRWRYRSGRRWNGRREV